jgi:hypothetical protein
MKFFAKDPILKKNGAIKYLKTQLNLKSKKGTDTGFGVKLKNLTTK